MKIPFEDRLHRHFPPGIHYFHPDANVGPPLRSHILDEFSDLFVGHGRNRVQYAESGFPVFKVRFADHGQVIGRPFREARQKELAAACFRKRELRRRMYGADVV